MTDDEIRVKCAEALGLSDAKWMCENDHYPRWSTSVDAALTLCDRLREEDFDILITIEKAGYTVNVYIGQMALAEIEAPSLARAICLAFLKVKDTRK